MEGQIRGCGFSKSQMQITVEDGNTLVIQNDEKRKHENGEEEVFEYVKLERRITKKPLLRKFPLPGIANASAITAKCEDGELIVTVRKITPPKKSEVTIA